MLSYRHAFHAGNFADVLKHIVLIHILKYLAKKDKPFCCIDTHAGPGCYSLTSEYAQKNKEYENGIAKLWQRNDLPNAVAEYVAIVKGFNKTKKLTKYPGSPFFEKYWLRDKDRLFLYELHSTEVDRLMDFFNQDERITVMQQDGFEKSIKLFPPRERRGLMLIDPAYEIKTDYELAVDTLIHAYKRFPTGIYTLWYPVVQRGRIDKLELDIKNSGIKKIQLFELAIRADSKGQGMTASGVIVVNPSWTLLSEMEGALPYLVEVLGMSRKSFWRAVRLVGE